MFYALVSSDDVLKIARWESSKSCCCLPRAEGGRILLKHNFTWRFASEGVDQIDFSIFRGEKHLPLESLGGSKTFPQQNFPFYICTQKNFSNLFANIMRKSLCHARAKRRRCEAKRNQNLLLPSVASPLASAFNKRKIMKKKRSRRRQHKNIHREDLLCPQFYDAEAEWCRVGGRRTRDPENNENHFLRHILPGAFGADTEMNFSGGFCICYGLSCNCDTRCYVRDLIAKSVPRRLLRRTLIGFRARLEAENFLHRVPDVLDAVGVDERINGRVEVGSTNCWVVEKLPVPRLAEEVWSCKRDSDKNCLHGRPANNVSSDNHCESHGDPHLDSFCHKCVSVLLQLLSFLWKFES